MDTSEKVEELEDTKKADFKAVVEDLVRENSANDDDDDDDSVAAKETPEPEGDEHKPAEDLEEEEKGKENKHKAVVVSQYLTAANEEDHPVLEDDNKNEQSLDLDESNGFVSKEIIDSIPDHQNGFSSIVNINTSCVVTKGGVDDEPAEWALDEKINEQQVSSSVAIAMESKETEESSSSSSSSSSGAVVDDLVVPSSGAVVDDLVVPSSGQKVYAETGVHDSNMSEYPVSPGYQPLIAVRPLPLRRTSWMGCCGLFQVLKRSDRNGTL